VPTQHSGHLDLQTKLDRVEKRSRANRKAVFNNLGHLINLEMLRLCHHRLDGKKAVGIDGITKEVYERNLEENLKDLLMRIRKGSYHPKPSRITEIPKADGSKRPLAISCYEDKIVQEAVRRILEKIYEPIFRDYSHGFRPGRSCGSALVALNEHLNSYDCDAVLEIDLRKYFNTIPHEPLLRLLKLKIQDQRFLHLIFRLLKAPTLNKEGRPERNEVGSPQGSILSPIIANLYLHYVMDIWFSWVNDKEFVRGGNLVRYADDAVFTFPTLKMAQEFKILLVERLKSFGISINEDKTHVLACGPGTAFDYEHKGLRMPTFTFLGFLHVWGKAYSRKRKAWFWRVKRRTCPKRFRKKLFEIKTFTSQHRHDKNLLIRIKRIVRGYLNYFAINDNLKRARQFVKEVRRMLFKYLNHRGGNRKMNWERFSKILEKVKFPTQNFRGRTLFFNRACTWATSHANVGEEAGCVKAPVRF
jgi:RNA-directed DNA polymerase